MKSQGNSQPSVKTSHSVNPSKLYSNLQSQYSNLQSQYTEHKRIQNSFNQAKQNYSQSKKTKSAFFGLLRSQSNKQITQQSKNKVKNLGETLEKIKDKISSLKQNITQYELSQPFNRSGTFSAANIY